MIRVRARSALRAIVERIAGRFYEGPEPPRRFAEQARVFLLQHPAADVRAWEEFAVSLAGTAYREAYVRGLEHAKRVEERGPAALETEEDRARHEWLLEEAGRQYGRAFEGNDPNDPLRGIPPFARADVFDLLGQVAGTHRVIVVPGDDDAA